MSGELNEIQIDNILLNQAVGRVACVHGKRSHIIPVTFAYNGKDIVGHAKDGMKVEIMRKNPDVCFEVDTMTNMTTWESVIIFGTFTELKGKESEKAREYLYNRVWPLLTRSSLHPHQHEISGDIEGSDRVKPVMYRITIKEKSGRFEKR